MSHSRPIDWTSLVLEGFFGEVKNEIRELKDEDEKEKREPLRVNNRTVSKVASSAKIILVCWNREDRGAFGFFENIRLTFLGFPIRDNLLKQM